MRVKPGLRSAKASSSCITKRMRLSVSFSSSKMRLIRDIKDSSINSIKPSNIRALLGKWRYSAASDTPTCLASFAVVMREAPSLDSSISARACRISSRRLIFLLPAMPRFSFWLSLLMNNNYVADSAPATKMKPLKCN
ncbi:Uncharacterised protein [Vibrio cholerae]|nr:Uncharacterised protein [Vibrio cholerae]